MIKRELLEQLSAYGILAYDLRLFLDVNPTNQEALSDFRRVVADYNKLIAQYEQQFGPLVGSRDTDGSWTHNPWPWHQDMGGNA